LTNATKEANDIILLRLGETETRRKGERVASQMKKLQSRNNYGAKMELTIRKNNHYLLVKLNARDRNYLDGFRKHESKKVVRNTDKYFSSMIAIHTKAVFVMQTAMILEDKKMASPALINAVFNDLDKSMINHVKVITKYYKKLCDIYDRKTGRKKKKQRKQKK